MVGCKVLNLLRSRSHDKILHGLCPDNLRHKFVERSMVSECKTRKYRDLQIPKVGLEYAKRSFDFSGVKNWNDIPGNVQSLQDPNTTP